jgi:hypothetical protein
MTGCVLAIGNDTDHGDDEIWHDRQVRNEQSINQMSLGRSIHTIRSELGKPDFRESFVRDGNDFEVLFYRTHEMRRDGVTSRDETTPLVFVNERLVGWGYSAIDKATAG